MRLKSKPLSEKQIESQARRNADKFQQEVSRDTFFKVWTLMQGPMSQMYFEGLKTNLVKIGIEEKRAIYFIYLMFLIFGSSFRNFGEAVFCLHGIPTLDSPKDEIAKFGARLGRRTSYLESMVIINAAKQGVGRVLNKKNINTPKKQKIWLRTAREILGINESQFENMMVLAQNYWRELNQQVNPKID